MKVHITITAGKGGGKTHLANALKEFLRDDYPGVGPMDVTIIELTPQGNTCTGTTFQLRPPGPLPTTLYKLLKDSPAK